MEASKWEGKVTAALPSATADEAWSLLSDFCSLARWFPLLETSYVVAGVEGIPGCVRHCVGKPGSDGEPAYWAEEELLALDRTGRSYRYKITENNMGFGQYVATLGVVPEGPGCRIEWSFESEPVTGWTEDGFAAYLRVGAEAIAARVEEALKDAASTE